MITNFADIIEVEVEGRKGLGLDTRKQFTTYMFALLIHKFTTIKILQFNAFFLVVRVFRLRIQQLFSPGPPFNAFFEMGNKF